MNPGRGARMARRDDREYREYLREEQRRQPGCPARESCHDPRGRDTSHGRLDFVTIRSGVSHCSKRGDMKIRFAAVALIPFATVILLRSTLHAPSPTKT